MAPEFWLQPWKPVIAEALKDKKQIFEVESEVQTTLAWARRTHRWGKEPAMSHLERLEKRQEPMVFHRN